MTPGATDNARWMVKAIYCLKIYLFQGKYFITAREKKEITCGIYIWTVLNYKWHLYMASFGIMLH